MPNPRPKLAKPLTKTSPICTSGRTVTLQWLSVEVTHRNEFEFSFLNPKPYILNPETIIRNPKKLGLCGVSGFRATHTPERWNGDGL